MPIFKLSDCKRNTKALVVASTLNELITKGSSKLQLPQNTLKKVVLEEDGTVVDEDEVLIELSGASKVLMLLQDTEVWCPVNDIQVDFCSPTEQSNFTLETEKTSFHGNYEELQKCPLPRFSPMVLKVIDGGSNNNTVPETIWSTLVSETANYYLGLFPNLQEANEYRIIGTKMFRRYPCIGLDGKHPWSAFNKSLSQKIRHIKHQHKAKSRRTLGGEEIEPKRPLIVVQATNANDSLRHEEELKKEWAKNPKNRNIQHIQKLFNLTRQKRLELLTSKTGRTLSSTIEQFPCLQDGQFILTEFTATYGRERVVAIADNLKILQVAVEEHGNFNSENEKSPLRMLDVIRYIEQKTSLHQGKGVKPKSVIEEFMDVPDKEVEEKLKTKELEGPHIVIFLTNNFINSIFIVGDGSKISINVEGGIITAIFKLLAIYYIFDLQYPRVYAMCMGVLQVFAMQEPLKITSSKKYKVFTKELKLKFDEIKSSMMESNDNV